MNIEEFREFCLSLKGTTESLPFGDNTLVMKAAGKIFALTDINSFLTINVKCDPEKAVELREKYNSITAGYHMNKKHWNTIQVNSELSDKEIKYWIQYSYDLIVNKLSKSEKALLNDL
jgi:predicted DNA-binding protein (MmcQ/YjbR family)